MIESVAHEIPIERKIPTIMMILISFLTLGIYPVIWIIKRSADFNNLDPENRPRFNNIWLLIWLVCNISYKVLYICMYNPDTHNIPSDNISYILLLVISYKMLKKMQIYAKAKYDTDIKINLFAWFFFDVYYVNYVINSFSKYIIDNKKNVNLV